MPRGYNDGVLCDRNVNGGTCRNKAYKRVQTRDVGNVHLAEQYKNYDLDHWYCAKHWGQWREARLTVLLGPDWRDAIS